MDFVCSENVGLRNLQMPGLSWGPFHIRTRASLLPQGSPSAQLDLGLSQLTFHGESVRWCSLEGKFLRHLIPVGRSSTEK